MSVDMGNFIAPKSDQLNADDLIAGPRTITITSVRANEGSAEQPISVYFEGDNGKPYKPGKSMRRVMVRVWGAQAAAYVGRSMTIYRDDDVQFGGIKVGGVRISHMSHIDGPQTMALTSTRARRAAFTVQPLTKPAAAQEPQAPAGLSIVMRYQQCTTSVDYDVIEADRKELWSTMSASEKAAAKSASVAAAGRLANA